MKINKDITVTLTIEDIAHLRKLMNTSFLKLPFVCHRKEWKEATNILRFKVESVVSAHVKELIMSVAIDHTEEGE